jgi:hypothetical protein
MCVPIGSDDEGDRCSVAEVSQAEQFRPSPGSGGTIDSSGSTTLADAIYPHSPRPVGRGAKGLPMNKVYSVAADASRRASLLVAYIRPVCALLAPRRAGASTPIIGTFIPERVLMYASPRRHRRAVRHVTGADVCRMLNAAKVFCRPWRFTGGAYRDISVRITIRFFEANRWMAYLRIPEIDEIKTVPHLPLQIHRSFTL